MLCLFSYIESIPLTARGWVRLPLAFARVWEERLGILPREWRNAERRSSRTAGGSHRCPPGRLCSPTHWRGWLGCNKHADPPIGAQDEWGSQHPSVLHSSPICPQQTIGSWYPVTEVDKHSHLRGRPMLRMQLSVGNFLVKRSTHWSCFFNLPDTEAITTSLSALGQHRKPIKTRKKHKL